MATSNGSPDKNELYGEWLKGQEWKRQLQKSVTHKALDVAEADDVNLSVNKNTGVGNAGLIGAVAAAGLGPAILGLAMLLRGGQTAPPATAPGPADANYQIRFFDKDGRPINVKPLEEKPK